MQKQNNGFHSGFVAILGAPNVGKSSIMNRFVGEKVSIVSNRPQTTRTKLLGVASRDDVQIVFVDTPGLHRPRTKLGEYMMNAARDAKEGMDAVLFVTDGQRISSPELMQEALKMNCPKFLAVNKIDLCSHEELMPQMAKLNDLGFDEVVPVSARTGKNMEVLWKLIAGAMPDGPKYFPDDMITDQPEQVLVAEIIREKALRSLSEEIPHGIGVEMLGMKKVSDRLMEIHANVYCEKESHKAIIIGKHAAMLKKIGTEARADIERLLGIKVMLQLWVKVREDWRNKPGDLKTLGYVKEE